ncbi:MAG: Gldg family protein [Treponema sp.]|nr:Gldg family protein [Treponema sp.]
MVRALSFSKTYSKKSKAACVDVTLSAERGKTTVLLGPNGAGKSTLLKAFCAQHYATSGKILAERSDGAIFDAAQSPEEVKAMTGFVSEVPALYDDWTVIEFLEMAAALRLAENDCKTKTAAGIKTDCKTRTEAAQKAARLCKLDSVLNQKISTLSHGYKQRVNFAQALVADPEILILDEPATGLDPEQIRETRNLVQDLKKSRAVIFSTHIIQEAASLSDTIYIIKDGRVAASGSPSELMKKSGSKNLEDAYLFFVSDPRASSNFGRSNDSGVSNDPRGSGNLSLASERGMSNDSAASTDSSLATVSRPATVSTAVNAPAFWGLAKKELFSYAINPFYWAAAVLFSLFSSSLYFFGTRFFVQGAGSSSLSPFFLAMPYALSVLFPALCMNIKSRGFDRSIPFGELSKTAARVVAALAFFALCLAPTIFVPLCVSFFGNVDFGAALTAYLGLVFFAAASISFCVFLSCLFKSQAAYFAFSVIALAAINYSHVLLTYLPLSDFFAAAVRSISFAWRFDSASKGIFDTRDFLSFALWSLVFSLLSVYVKERGKGRKFFCKGRALNTITIILIVVFRSLDASRLYRRLDFSADKNYTPSERTKKLLAGADEKIKISYYRSSELLKLYPQTRDVEDFLRSLSYSCKNVDFSALDADKPKAKQILQGLSIQPFQLQKQKDNALEYMNAYSAVVIDYMDKSLYIPAAFSTFSLEYDLNLRLDYLLNQKSRRAYILCANGMDLSKDFKGALDWLNLEGFETISLDKESFAFAKLDKSLPLILVGTSGLDQGGAEALENFLEEGGRVLAMASPYAVDINGNWGVSKNKLDFVLPIFERLGISFLDSLAADLSCVRANFYSSEPDGKPGQNKSVNYPLWISLLPQAGLPYGATVFWASPLSVDKAKAQEALFSSPASWRFLPDKKNPGLLFDTNPFTVPKSAVSDPLVQKSQSVLAAKSLQKNLFVISGDLFVNDLLLSLSGGETGDFRNLNYLTSSLLSLSGEEDLAALKNKGAVDYSLWKISGAEEWKSAKNFTLLVNFIIVPIVILLFALIFFSGRRARLNKYFSKGGE